MTKDQVSYQDLVLRKLNDDIKTEEEMDYNVTGQYLQESIKLLSLFLKLLFLWIIFMIGVGVYLIFKGGLF